MIFELNLIVGGLFFDSMVLVFLSSRINFKGSCSLFLDRNIDESFLAEAVAVCFFDLRGPSGGT